MPSPSDVRDVLPARVRARRRELGLAQHELGERAGVSTEFVSRIERGAAVPSLATLLRLCTALACTPNDLLLAPKAGRAPLADRMEQLRRRLEGAPAPAARQALRVAEAVLEYEARGERRR